MNEKLRRIGAACAAAVLAAVLAVAFAGCSGGAGASGEGSGTGAQSASGAQASSQDAGSSSVREPSSSAGGAAEGEGAVREQIEQAFARVREATYKNVTFTRKTQTTATGTDGEGRMSQQSVTAEMKGELSLAKKNRAMHFSYLSKSSTQLGKVAYDMYVDDDALYVVQDGKLYTNGDEDATAEGYISAITDIVSEEAVTQLLDVASSCKIERADGGAGDGADAGSGESVSGDITITITADASKVGETGLVDTSSLPEGSSIATMVASYVISPNDRLKTVRLMSSTAGTPTYRVNQTYHFSKYNKTELPEWPSMADQAVLDPRIKTDEDGRMYIVGDDGLTYYIDSIDEDGTIHASTQGTGDAAGEASAEGAGDASVITYDNPVTYGGGQSTSGSGSTSGGSGSTSTSGSDSTSGSTSGGGSTSTSGNAGLDTPGVSGGDANTSSALDEPGFYAGDATQTTSTSESTSESTSDTGTSSSGSDGEGSS